VNSLKIAQEKSPTNMLTTGDIDDTGGVNFVQ